MRELCGPSAFACVFTEKLKHLSIECRDIAGLSATDPIPVAHNFLIHPVSAECHPGWCESRSTVNVRPLTQLGAMDRDKLPLMVSRSGQCGPQIPGPVSPPA